MLGGAGGKYAPHLADQGAPGPEPAGAIEKLAHLTAHVAETGGSAEDDGIGSRQVLRLAHRDMGLGLLRLESAHLRQDVFREGFRNAADPDLGTSHAARPFSYRLPQPVDMAVHRVIDNQYFHNASPFLFEINVLLAVSGRNHHMRPVSMPVKIGMSN